MIQSHEHNGTDSDAALVARTRAGDHEAFGLLYDRYARLIRCICHDGTGDLDAALDLTQDVFLQAYTRIGQLRNTDRFAQWLMVISRRTVLSWRRRQAKDQVRLIDGLEDLVDDVPARDAMDELRRAIRRLPERERMAIHLYYLNENSSAIARHVMGLSAPGFYAVLSRARARLARMLDLKVRNER